MAIKVHHMFFSVLAVKSNIARIAKQIIEVQDARSHRRMQSFFVLPQVAVEGVDVKMASCLASILPASRCLLVWPVQTPEWRI